MENDDKRRGRKILPILSMLVIGALGSGLWDVLLKDLIYSLGNIFVSIASSLYSGYIDTLYEGVGKQFNFLSYLPGFFIISFLIFAFPFACLYVYRVSQTISLMKNERVELSPLERKIGNFILEKQKYLFAAILLPMLFISILYTNSLIKEISQLRAVNYIERAIDIVRPGMTDKQYYQFRSEFRQINSRDKVANLIKGLALVAEQNHLFLPEPKLYGYSISSKAFKKET